MQRKFNGTHKHDSRDKKIERESSHHQSLGPNPDKFKRQNTAQILKGIKLDSKFVEQYSQEERISERAERKAENKILKQVRVEKAAWKNKTIDRQYGATGLERDKKLWGEQPKVSDDFVKVERSTSPRR